MTKYVRAIVGPLFVLLLLVAALWLLHHELWLYHLRDFRDSLRAIPALSLCFSVALTGINYLTLVGYDLLGFRYIRHPLAFRRVALASFLSHAVGHNFGALLGGSSIRYRLYSAWGLSSVEIVRLVLLLGVTFWIGLFALAGVMFLIEPTPIPERLHLPLATTRPIGVGLSVLSSGYLLLCLVRRAPIRIGKWDFELPSLWLSLLELALAAMDLLATAGALYVLLPASVDVGFTQFLSLYLLALIAAILSHVPGGLGVLELVLLVLLRPSEPHQVIGALLAFRAIYYLFPLAVAVVALGANELLVYRTPLAKAARTVARIDRLVAPRLLSFTVFGAGAILLLSGATPAVYTRLELLSHVLPLPVLELSHFLNSVFGVLLLLLARGLQRRVETAFYAAATLLGGGIAVSLFKGFDYEVALVLGAMLAVLINCRGHFYRRGALLTERFTLRWFVAVGMVLACTTWLVLFAIKHVEYRDEWWWEFTFHGQAPRLLRAVAGATTVALFVACWRLLRVHTRPPLLPNDVDLADARRIVERSRQTVAQLAFLGDKRFLFNADRTAFVMYGVEGRSWVSMGDPIGDETAARELAWDYFELCDEGGRWPVFYQVDEDRVPMYVEMGLTLIKIGEEAHVPLTDFHLEGNTHKGLRRTSKQLTDAGCTFEIIEPPLDDALVAELKRISDAWLAEKHAAEKGFSLGFFQPEYLRACPVSLVRQHDRLIAFANIWRGADNVELSLDLMRHLPDAPDGTMEYLFIQLMLWGHDHKYQQFNLGMSPLSGIDQERLAPLWNHVAALAFRHGEHFYNFQGLRQYKGKFHPVWNPKYLASPGGFALPLILTNVATLISGGLRRLVAK